MGSGTYPRSLLQVRRDGHKRVDERRVRPIKESPIGIEAPQRRFGVEGLTPEISLYKPPEANAHASVFNSRLGFYRGQLRW